VTNYYGARRWRWRVGNKSGTIELRVPDGNRSEDESHVRFLLRRQLGLKVLPRGAVVEPEEAPSGKPLMQVFDDELVRCVRGLLDSLQNAVAELGQRTIRKSRHVAELDDCGRRLEIVIQEIDDG
jgi:hypothetical protein